MKADIDQDRKHLEEFLEEVKSLHHENTQLRKELADCSIALNDWILTFASEFCDEDQVRDAFQRITDSGGTLAYIARLQERIRKTLQLFERSDDRLSQ